MTLSRDLSSSSIDIDEFIQRPDDTSPTDSATSSEESLSNSTEFKKQNELLNTINEFKSLEKNETNSNDLLPMNNVNSMPVPSAPSAPCFKKF